MARLSGEVAPLWVTFAAVLDRPLEVPRLRAALAALVAGTPRLQLAWVEPGARWRRVHRSDACLLDALRADDVPAPLRDLQAAIINDPIDLGADLPLRLHHRALSDGAGPALLVFQLHHAIGDARALTRIARQLWRLYHDPAALDAPWGGPACPTPDAALARLLLRAAPGWLPALRPASFLLAQRGASLPRAADTIGPPHLAARRVRLASPPRRFGGMLTAAIAAAIAPQVRGDLLRLRMPVDLAAPLGLEGALANTCVAIPVELSRGAVLHALDDADRLRRICRDALGAALRRGVPQVALLECLLTSRLASADLLRRNARPGLLAHPRTNTLVTTHVGSLDATFEDLPARIVDAWGHTPTWGVNSFALGQDLFVHATGFQGMNTPDDLNTLADAVTARLRWIDQELAP